jgi:hypothetical protein
MVVDDVPPFVEPKGRTVDQWYKEDYKKWLKVRGEPTKGDKDLLKERVMNFLKLLVDQQPQFLPMEWGGADGMMQMLRCMVVMFTTLMQPAIEGEKHAEMIALRVCLFLNAVVEFEVNMKKKNETEPLLGKRKDLPMWLLRSNFFCLLNLSDTVREFGSLHNYFEGKYLGERFVQEVKDAHQHCLHQNVTTNLLKKLHQGKALEAMASPQSEKVIISLERS